MDVTFTIRFDAKRYARAVRRALVFSFRGVTIFSWCMLVAMFGFVFNWWLGGCPEEGRFLWLAILFFGFYPGIILRAFKRIYVRHMQQMLGVVGIRQSALPEMRTTSCNAILQYI